MGESSSKNMRGTEMDDVYLLWHGNRPGAIRRRSA